MQKFRVFPAAYCQCAWFSFTDITQTLCILISSNPIY